MHSAWASAGRVHLRRSWDAVRVKGLVWLGIPAQDYAGAVRFFREVLGLAVAFDAPGTVELSAENGDKIQLFGPGHQYFGFCRGQGASIVPLLEVDDLDAARADLLRSGVAAGLRYWASQSRMVSGGGLPSGARWKRS